MWLRVQRRQVFKSARRHAACPINTCRSPQVAFHPLLPHVTFSTRASRSAACSVRRKRLHLHAAFIHTYTLPETCTSTILAADIFECARASGGCVNHFCSSQQPERRNRWVSSPLHVRCCHIHISLIMMFISECHSFLVTCAVSSLPTCTVQGIAHESKAHARLC